jgi:hypothetical protein
VRLRPAQIHPQQHFRPVLRLRATRTRLDIEVRAIRVHFAGEHAPEFETLDSRLESLQVPLDFGRRGRVVFVDRERQEFIGIPQAVGYLVQPDNDLLQLRPLPAERLRPLGLVPDVRLFQLALDFGQTFRLLIVVKDTSSTRPRVQ